MREPRTASEATDHGDRTARAAVLVDQLHAIVEDLEAMHPGRKFPLDEHLVGSIGEAAAGAMFDLVAASSAGHDAIARDGARVEIKATYGSAGVALRKTSDLAASALIVLRHSRTTPRPTRGRIQRAARDRTTGGRPRSKQWTGAHEPGSASGIERDRGASCESAASQRDGDIAGSRPSGLAPTEGDRAMSGRRRAITLSVLQTSDEGPL